MIRSIYRPSRTFVQSVLTNFSPRNVRALIIWVPSPNQKKKEENELAPHQRKRQSELVNPHGLLFLRKSVDVSSADFVDTTCTSFFT